MAWHQLLDEPASGPDSAAAGPDSPRLPRVAVCGMSHMGMQLAECLMSKAGTAQLAMYDSEADLKKYTLLPVRTQHPQSRGRISFTVLQSSLLRYMTAFASRLGWAQRLCGARFAHRSHVAACPPDLGIHLPS